MRKSVYLLILVLLVSSLLFGGCSFLAGEKSGETTPVTENISGAAGSSSITIPVSSSTITLPNIADVVAKVKPSVVAINTEVTTRDFFNRPLLQEAAGSGWIITTDGYIVTNNHVVADSQKISVILNDGQVFQATIVGQDSLTDLAVIKIDANNLPAASVGDSSIMRVGDWVVAIGNSLGQGSRATLGIVSQLEVSLQIDASQVLYGLIETDAAINPGNSGGPLVNLAGEVIGINSVKQVQVEIEGVGYAISTNEAVPVIEQLIETGEASHPWLGVSLYPVDQYVITTFGLTIDRGVFLVEVDPDSPAGKAGLKPQDVILKFNGKEIKTMNDLIIGIRSAKIEQEVEIVYWRGGKEETTSAILLKRPSKSS